MCGRRGSRQSAWWPEQRVLTTSNNRADQLFASLALVFPLLQIPDAVATFDGVFKSADKKFVNVQVESGETMRMYVARGTKYAFNGRPAKPSDFHNGDRVTVDAERVLA